MKLSTAISRATAHLLKSKRARMYRAGNGNVYFLDIERNPEDKEWLTVTTWGFDYEGIKIPQNRQELIGLKIRAQVAHWSDSVAQVAKRYYLDILRREAT